MTIRCSNANLETYLNDFAAKNRMRYQYLRNKYREKVGVITVFQNSDVNGRVDLFVGVSKVNKSTHHKDSVTGKIVPHTPDVFSLEIGLRRAIDNAIPFAEFVQRVQNGQGLPLTELTWKNVRDENGRITGQISWYDQYQDVVRRLKTAYSKMFNTKEVLV